ncbi:MAG: hypothetical protein AB1726_12590 [Planctomycetota bacterium]
MRIVTIIPALLASALLAGARAETGEDQARERYLALLESHRAAGAIEIAGTVEMTTRFAGEEEEESGFRAKVEVHAMRPAAGRLRLEYAPLRPAGAEAAAPAATTVLEHLGDGTAIYAIDREAKTAQKVAASWSVLFPLGSLFDTWCGPPIAAGDIVSVAAEAGDPTGGTTLRIARRLPGAPADEAPGIAEVLRLDAAGRPLGGSVVVTSAGPRTEVRTTFTRWELVAEPAPADYAGAIPAGFTRIEAPDYEARLLAVGTAAPEVSLMDMEDRSFALSSLRGETVLVSFWFYH